MLLFILLFLNQN